MKHTLKSLALLAALAMTVASTGCTKHFVMTANDHASGEMTLVETRSENIFRILTYPRHVFWECKETKDRLDCYKVCDRKDEQGYELRCPRLAR